MELVYIYIEKYRNIKYQEMNLSSKYNFKFVQSEKGNDKAKIEYEPRKAKIAENFWSNSIKNVSLLVGQNGTGKSNFLRCLVEMLRENDLPFEGNALAIFEKSSKFQILNCGVSFLPTFDNTKMEKSFPLMTPLVYTPFFNLLTLTTDPLVEELDNSHSISTISTVKRDIDLRTRKNLQSVPYGEVAEIYQEEELNRQLDTYSELTERELPFQVPDVLFITTTKSDRLEIEGQFPELKEWLDLNYEESLEQENIQLPEIWLMAFYKSTLINFIKTKYKYSIKRVLLSEIESMEKELKNKPVITIQDITEYFESIYKSQVEPKISERANNILKLFEKLKNYINNTSAGNNSLNQIANESQNYKDQSDTPFLQVKLKNRGMLDGSYSLEDLKDLLKVYFNSIIFNDGFLSFLWRSSESNNDFQFSTGELNLLQFYSRIGTIFKNSNVDKKPVLLLLDEPDITLHPEWQRTFIRNLIEYLSSKKAIVQVIITTHSPIMASDFPSTNVFRFQLEDDENYDSKRVVINKSENETFAANIHSLYHDAFYLKGLLGAFAQEKIEKIYEKVKNFGSITVNEEDLYEEINIIGEPILRNKLREVLLEKVTRETKIRLLQKEIERLKSEQSPDA